MAKIRAIKAREILDSRGIPTIETTIWSDLGHATIASIPSGASTGKYESVELRDNDPTRYDGQGVSKAVDNVNNIIAPAVIGLDPTYQTKLDKVLIDLDGEKNKSKLGANAILSVSQAVCELGALVSRLPTYKYLSLKYGLTKLTGKMPTPMFNLINGGKHGAGNSLDFQEFHVVPSSRNTFAKNLQIGDDIYRNLREALKKRGAVYSVGDEGGYAPNLYSNTDAMELLVEAINLSRLILGKDVFLAIDAAANSFFSGGKYRLKDKTEAMDTNILEDFYAELVKNYNLFSIEDPFAEDDFDAFARLTASIGSQAMIVADDILVTNKARLMTGLEKKSFNAVLIKPNQVGTISETVEVVKIAKEKSLSVIVSHRSGETNDDFIADFAVGVGADYTKFGAPARGERLAKYNRLLAIENEITHGI